MSYTHFTASERGRIQSLREEKKGMQYIADVLGCHKTSISRELRRNRGPFGYDAQRAQTKYEVRRTACKPIRKLDYEPLWNYVIEHIVDGWTPEQIANRLPIECPDDTQMRISHEALYQAIYSDDRLHFLRCLLPQARAKRRKRGQGKSRRGPSIPHRVGIEHRPQEANERARYGDWEGDTVVGANQQGFIVTLVDRKSRLLRAWKIDSKDAQVTADAVIESLLDDPPSWLKTITFDNGTEFARHQRIASALGVTIFFAAPYSSYQRGTNENTNGLIRRFFPKGTNFRHVTQELLDHVCDMINNRPRKVLGYRTPNELFADYREKALVALGA
jgi:IS30 family transposase